MKKRLITLGALLSSVFLMAFAHPVTKGDLQSHEWIGHVLDEDYQEVEDLDLIVTFSPEVIDISLDFDHLWQLVITDNPEADNALVKTLVQGTIKRLTNKSYYYVVNEGVLTVDLDNFSEGTEVTFMIEPEEDRLILQMPENYALDHPEINQILSDYHIDLSQFNFELIPVGAVE